MIDAEKKMILIIDDDKFLVDMYSMKFTMEGYAVQACLSAKDALNLLRGGLLPDVIMFDLTMPELDGLSFLTALTEEKLAPKALKIALTNQSEDAEQKKAMDLGADKYIVKASAIPSEVVDIVGKAIGRKTV
ncbi:MAG: Transcriptional regulator, Crp/Fnr family [Candidatus Kaiserbacteria bacterium GW2011_GWB1_52_6]|uniref:Transcriptional regulator, Crp/Fnr family n=2 Tax=Candidatus Kaiseribacteriota TaxID=1752734 RepID=A0A0G2A628_9BACT|nr:MAG: Transcriptional regulator, Crp/Fnr family [Candidatus Kaiserbacteria bacterium GW2011_GWA2_52_12]KKW27749.1 MAG: Transcriptional regulator, Crp/Fnr family [Candidatus Kaiserbacteria bacterium GW2011_GWB1_52_6]